MSKQDISIRHLVDKVISRELALPEMQRKYSTLNFTKSCFSAVENGKKN